MLLCVIISTCKSQSRPPDKHHHDHSDDYHYHDYQVTQRSVWGVVPLGHIVLTDSASVIQVTILIMIIWIIQTI